MAVQKDRTEWTQPGSVERELKLECDPRDIGTLLHHRLLASAEPLPRLSGVLVATYFDTPGQTLRRAGISLRVRKHHGRFIQTVKAEHAVRALALNRNEWETEVDGNLNLAALRHAAPDVIFDKETNELKIDPVFSVTTRRHAFQVLKERSTLELSLDRTTVTALNRNQRFTEIEIESKTGDPQALFVVANELVSHIPLRLTVLTKSEHGYRLLDETPPVPDKATHPLIIAGTRSAEAFHKIAGETLSRIVRNEEALRSFGEPEALHQMRVDFRRLRTAMSIFSKMLEGPETRATRNELRRYARLLGEARDLDIVGSTLREGTNDPLTQSDIAAVADRRTLAYGTIAKKLGRPRLKQSLLRTAIWIEAGAWISAPSAKALHARDKPVEKTARKWLSRIWKRIRRDAKRLEKLSVERRHELRKQIKALRYGSEFFADTFTFGAARRRRKSMLKHLEQLQEALGAMNDIAMRQQILPSLADMPRSEVASRIDLLMPEATRVAHRLRESKPFWK